MKCPKCKASAIVRDVVYNDDQDEQYRRCECPICKEVFATVEFTVVVNDRFRRDWSKYHRKGGRRRGEDN